jgi:glutamyl-tRNA synthetase
LLAPFLSDRGYPERPAGYLAKAARTLQPRTHTLVEMADAMRFYMIQDITFDPDAARKFLTQNMIEPFQKLVGSLERMAVFDEANLEKTFHELAAETGLKLGKIAQPVRVALTGLTVSPGLFEIIDVLGKETVLGRLRLALQYMNG